MIEEVNILGVFMPAPLLWAVAALAMTSLCGRLLRSLRLRSLVLRPALLDLAIFFLTWWGISSLADASFSHGIIS